MKYNIPQYSEDRTADIGKANLSAIKSGFGEIKFSGIYIHLAPFCNFRCKGCFTHMEKNRNNRLELVTIKKIVEFAKKRDVKTIVFAGAGEPTMDPEFEKICDLVWESGLKTTLFTNMTNIKNVDQAKKYLERGSVIGKLFTLNPDKYNLLVGNKLAHKQAFDGLDFLIKARDEIEKEGKNTVLAIDSYITQDNYKDLPDLLRFCRQKGIIPYFEAFIELGQPKNNIEEMAISEKELAELFVELAKIDKEEFGIETPIKIGSRNYGQDPCNKATHMFCVKETGKVYMCVCTLREVGSIYDKSDPLASLENIFSIKNNKLLDFFKCDHCSKVINAKYL